MRLGHESPTTGVRFETVGTMLGGCAALLTLIAMLGWAFDLPSLGTFGVLDAEMTPLTASLLLVLGLSIVSLRWRRILRWEIVAAVTVVGVVALLVGVEHMSDVDFGIDNLMWSDQVSLSGQVFPGRPSVQTTLAVLLVAGGIIAFATPHRFRIGASSALAVVAGSIAAEALLGFVFGVDVFYSSVELGAGAMSIPTALSALLAATGLLLFSIGEAWSELKSDRTSWRMMSRLLPVALVVPIVHALTQALALTRGPTVQILSSLAVAAALTVLLAVVWVSGRDVRRLSLEREAASAEADRANQAKSEFLSNMSHELRTPLNSVIGFAQLLEVGDLDARQAQSVGSILKAGRHLLDLINDILDLSRIETGVLEMSPEPVLLEEVISEGLRLVEPMADTAGVVLTTQPGRSRQNVLADRKRLLQVLLNLLSNAIKYNRHHGTVTVSWEEPREGLVKISISDEGNGLSPDQIARLFTPFERLDADGSGVEGVGIGLALSQRLIHAMGGEVNVASTPGEGSTFWFELVEAEGAMQRYERIEKDHTGEVVLTPGAKRTLLYIEDNVANLALVERILEEFERPYTVMSAMQGRMGLDLALEHRPSLILLDLHLPDMTGDEVLTQLKQAPVIASIPVVVMTADASPGRLSRLLEAGAEAYLVKPIDLKDLLRVIDDLTEPG